MTSPLLIAALCLSLLLPLPAGAMTDLAVGGEPPSFSLADPSGNTFTPDFFAGRPAAILFWSTWSPRSAEMLEDFRQYHRDYSEQGLTIVAVNSDGEGLDRHRRAQVSAYVEEKALPFSVLLDENLETYASYGVMALPSAVLIDTDGRIAYTLGGYPPSLRGELREYLLKTLGLWVEEVREEAPDALAPRSDALMHYNLGRNMAAKGRTERALAALRKAALLDPSFFDPVILAARLSLADGDENAVEALLAQADGAAVNRSDLLYLRGMLLLSRGEGAAAEELFLDLQERAPGEGWELWGLGLTALSRGETVRALELLKEASTLQPHNIEAEAYLKHYLITFWRQGGTPPGEKDLVALAPALGDIQKRYRLMFRARDSGNPAGDSLD